MDNIDDFYAWAVICALAAVCGIVVIAGLSWAFIAGIA